MARQAQQRIGIKNISLELQRSAFSALFHLFSGEELFQEVSQVRSLLSNERAKLLHIIKQNNPSSVYSLAKLAGRDFQSVKKDLKLLEHLEIIKLEKYQQQGKKGKSKSSLKPILSLDSLQINIKF